MNVLMASGVLSSLGGLIIGGVEGMGAAACFWASIVGLMTIIRTDIVRNRHP